MFSKRFFGPALTKPSASIKNVYAAQKPNFLLGSFQNTKWRYQSMGKTLDVITDDVKLMQLQKQAYVNLSKWSQNKRPSPQFVEVVNKDWGLATFEATKKHGKPYTVLNMANSTFPGGGVLEGLNAQEENMWHRSTCATSLLDDIVQFDEAAQTFCYHDTASRLLEGQVQMSDEEHAKLKKTYAATGPIAYKAFLSRDPRVCFRGPEVKLSLTSNPSLFVEHAALASERPDENRSYSFLPPEEIFPFYELRSAAPILPSEGHTFAQKAFDAYQTNLRQRIASQLDTLILEEKTHVVLGAWGCGVFKNNPKLVAQIYREEIEKRADFFEHMMFAIINTGSTDKYKIFKQQLDNIKLGAEPSNNSPEFKF
tara:strand:+ start:114294 stop:115397 length:1104 start_codon:yes stop_codon:yes gene_type:complete